MHQSTELKWRHMNEHITQENRIMSTLDDVEKGFRIGHIVHAKAGNFASAAIQAQSQPIRRLL